MGKIIETLCLNGKHKGIHKIELHYTEEQETAAKEKMKFQVDGIDYAGWCRICSKPVRQDEARYIENTDGYGRLHVDVFHKLCSK